MRAPAPTPPVYPGAMAKLGKRGLGRRWGTLRGKAPARVGRAPLKWVMRIKIRSAALETLNLIPLVMVTP